MRRMKFREIAKKDLPALAKLDAGIFKDVNSKHALEVFTFSFKNRILKASFVALDEKSGEFIGAIFVERSVGFKSPNAAYIRSLFVRPESQGKGLGRELMRRSMNVLKAARIEFVTIQVHTNNQPAIALYTDEGFEMTRYVYSKEILVK